MPPLAGGEYNRYGQTGSENSFAVRVRRPCAGKEGSERYSSARPNLGDEGTKMKRYSILAVACVCAVLAVPTLADMSVTVLGQACPYFAGQTSGLIPVAGTGDSANYHADVSNANTMPSSVDVSGLGGKTISIAATGTWGHPTLSGADGYEGYDETHAEYTALGISSVTDTRLNTLLGVFLTDAAPVAGTAPTALAFGSDMTNPLLQQAFVIGSSLGNITVPTDATRLFFGLNDGYEWTNNVGALDVTVSVVPLPAGLLLGLFGLGTAGWRLRKTA